MFTFEEWTCLFSTQGQYHYARIDDVVNIHVRYYCKRYNMVVNGYGSMLLTDLCMRRHIHIRLLRVLCIYSTDPLV
jgi:hypothetical protein